MKMGFLSRTFLRGVIVLLPLILTVWPLYYFFSSTDRMVGRLLAAAWPAADPVPGAGVVLGLLAIFLLGLLMSSRLVQRGYALIEASFSKLPLVRSLYVAFKELTRYLAPGEARRADQVVRVRVPQLPLELVGFVVRADLSGLPEPLARPGCAAVYIPMSYQIGGFTVFVPNEWLAPVAMPVEEAMKDVLTGWMAREAAGR